MVVEFDRFSGFLAETSANLSLGGMFLTTRYLKPVGSELQFEVRLKDAAPLIRGRGVVAWTRWQDQGPRRPAGMGVRFVEIDAESRELIYRIVDERLRSGQVGEELALDAEALRATEALPDLGPLPPLAPPEMPAEESPPEISLPTANSAPEPPPLAPADLDTPAEPVQLPVPSIPPPVFTPPLEAPPLADIVARASASWIPPIRLGAQPEPTAVPVPALPGANPPVSALANAAAVRPRPRRTPWIPLVLGALVVLAVGSGWWWARRSNPDGSATQDRASAPPAVSAPEPPAAAPAPSTPAPATSPVPADAPPPTTAAPAPPAAALPRFTRLEKVTWVEGSGTTDLVLWLDGSIPEGSFQRAHIEGREPRELVKLRGAKEPFVTGRLEVGTPEVRRVRTGFHAGTADSELHVVLDLAAGARVETTRVEGQALHLMVAFR